MKPNKIWYTETLVEIRNETRCLHAILSRPPGDGPVSAAILVHDGGPRDPDESMRLRKLWRNLISGLARRGVAVLRYEEQTCHDGDPTHPPQHSPGLQCPVHDIGAGFEWLTHDRRINAQAIYVLGHGMDGEFLPRTATSLPHLAGVISLAGPYLSQSLKPTDGVLNPSDTADSSKAARKRALGLSRESGVRTATPVDSPTSDGRDPADYDPGPHLQSTRIPALVLQGAAGLQATLRVRRRRFIVRWLVRCGWSSDVRTSYP